MARPIPTKNPASNSVTRSIVLREYVGIAQGRRGSSQRCKSEKSAAVHIAGFLAGEKASNKMACGGGAGGMAARNSWGKSPWRNSHCPRASAARPVSKSSRAVLSYPARYPSSAEWRRANSSGARVRSKLTIRREQGKSAVARSTAMALAAAPKPTSHTTNSPSLPARRRRSSCLT